MTSLPNRKNPHTFDEFLQRRTPQIRHHLRTLGFAVEYFPRYVNRRLNLHSPGVVLLSYLIDGHGQHILGDDVYQEQGGALGITHYGEFHDIVTGEAGMEVMNIYLDLAHHPLPVLPRELQPVLPDIIPLHPCLRHRLNRVVRLVFDDHGAVTRMLKALDRELAECQPGYREAAAHYLTLFLIACCRQVVRSGLTPLVSALRPHDARMEEVRRYLDVHFAAPQTLAALAQRIDVTPAHLCRAFKGYTGITVFDYLLQRRIQDAMLRLRQGTEKIAAIALACGFNDLSHFNHTFKQIVGTTPREYRAGAVTLSLAHERPREPEEKPR